MPLSNGTDRENPLQILVVDDDPDMLRLMAATIEDRFGHEACVQSFTSPTEARRRLETGVADVLVTDLDMPGLGGLQLLRWAKRRNAWTQGVVVTGHSGLDNLTDAMDLGASDYLVKPLDLAELCQTLGEIVARLKRWRHSLARTLNPHAPS